jgi:hypothetical protein
MNERGILEFEFTRLILSLKKAITDKEKAEIFRDLSQETADLADYHNQRDPNYSRIEPLEIKTDGTF